MKKYLKKFSVMFVMSLILVLGSCISVFATEDTYTENLIPTMTSDSSPSGQVSFSSKWSRSWSGYYAFDKVLDDTANGHPNGWSTAKGYQNGWLAYEFDEPKQICKYTITACTGYNNTSPKSWDFQGSNDKGNTWSRLDSRNNETEWKDGEKRIYTFNNSKKYKVYRINVYTSNPYQDQAAQCTISQLEMMEKISVLASNIELNKIADILQIGQTDTLVATTTPSSVGITWKSSDESIATVDSNGKVTAVKEGQATITAKIKDSDIKAICVVTVTPKGTDPNPTEPTTGDTNLFIELVDGQIKSYSVSNDEIAKFKQWYIDRDSTKSNKPYYEFAKGTYKDYVIHDKIDWFEVR